MSLLLHPPPSTYTLTLFIFLPIRPLHSTQHIRSLPTYAPFSPSHISLNSLTGIPTRLLASMIIVALVFFCCSSHLVCPRLSALSSRMCSTSLPVRLSFFLSFPLSPLLFCIATHAARLLCRLEFPEHLCLCRIAVLIEHPIPTPNPT
ncbi:hypothetical protein EXIGLDRAFT_483042 [Exidia glandulosa HHB12029]|uniref:Uncharacterized protein n=1 Tax=Exidia glandulosa HHB12029 TaxID=1314781 RepID=A0A165PIC2_EXIGL|nr:hypothetical protein EXIGLDRAFT_483042 [Exidia glandulosa HHB12029]